MPEKKEKIEDNALVKQFLEDLKKAQKSALKELVLPKIEEEKPMQKRENFDDFEAKENERWIHRFSKNLAEFNESVKDLAFSLFLIESSFMKKDRKWEDLLDQDRYIFVAQKLIPILRDHRY